MFEAVLFDLDGTLIQFSACYADFMRDMATMWGITDAADPFFDHYGTAILAEGAVTFRSSIEFALAATGRKPSRDFNDQCRDAVRGYAGGIAVLPGTLELLASYQGLPKAIVSNGPSDMQRAALEASGLTRFFDHILISGDADVAVRKPSQKIFTEACLRLGVAPNRTLMIGDNMAVDVYGAQNAGLQAVHITQLTKASIPDKRPITG